MKGRVVIAAFAALFTVSAANADMVMHMDSVNFTSDLNPATNITLPKFDTLGGTLVLDSVTVDITHSGSVSIAGDNDDPFNAATVQARMIRTFNVAGPGVGPTVGTKTITSAFENLGVENGDGGTFDSSGPDGHAFGVLSYVNELAGSSNPAVGLYAMNGGGLVNFLVSPLNMVNDLNFVGTAPDVWQLEVQNPILTVKVKITYDYHQVPEPATLSLLAAGGFGLILRRRK